MASKVCVNRTLPNISLVLILKFFSGVLALIDGLEILDWLTSFLFEREETEYQQAQTGFNAVFSVPLCFRLFFVHVHSEIRFMQRQSVNGYIHFFIHKIRSSTTHENDIFRIRRTPSDRDGTWTVRWRSWSCSLFTGA